MKKTVILLMIVLVAISLFGCSASNFSFVPKKTQLSQSSNDVDTLKVSKKDGYYGYVDNSGKTVIGHYYDSAGEFHNGVAIVSIGGRFGAIDVKGDTVIDIAYDSVDFHSQKPFLIVEDRSGVVERNITATMKEVYGNPHYGLFDYSGKMIVNVQYEDFIFVGDQIYALITNKLQVADGGKAEAQWCNVFNLDGTMLEISDGDITSSVITVPINNVSVIYFEDPSRPNRYGYTPSHYMGYIDSHDSLLSDEMYVRAQPFNENGYAIAIYRIDGFGHEEYVVVRLDGTNVCTLPEYTLGYPSFSYTDANDYYASIYGYASGRNSRGYGIVNLKNFNLYEYGSVEMIDGTNCIIVSDLGTGLYGLIDGENIELDCVNSSINYSNGVFYVRRGAETAEYTPKR